MLLIGGYSFYSRPMTDKQPPSFRPDLFAAEAKKATGNKGLPPVHLWNPEFCGDIDMHIKRDGSWDYMGSPIARPAMVRLFSTILRHDEDGKYYLVTPVEKVGIRVDDAPFVAVEMRVEGAGEDQVLHFRSNVDDSMTADKDHPIRISYDAKGGARERGGNSRSEDASGSSTHQTNKGGPCPYILVRDRLEALISRSVYYQLAELAVEKDEHYGVWSGGCFFVLGPKE